MGTIHAIFENGVFRPLNPVDLPDGCRVALERFAVVKYSPASSDSIADGPDNHNESSDANTARHIEHQP